MTRYRAERLVEIARSKGVKATALSLAPSRPGASTPFLYMVKLQPKQPRETEWCYSTTHFFSTLKRILAYQQDTEK